MLEGHGMPKQVHGYMKTVFKNKQCQFLIRHVSKLFACFPYKEVQQGHQS